MVVRDTWQQDVTERREAKNGLSNGTDIRKNTGINEILETALLRYNTVILEDNWIRYRTQEHKRTPPARADGDERSGTKFQRRANMN